jgi:predicted esterase
MAPSFHGPDEVREVLDQVFALVSEDPEMGPRVREADPQRFELTDVDLVVNLRGGRDGEPGNLHWRWTDEVDWQPRLELKMSSQTANRFFQGKEDLPLALARRRIRTGGDVGAALALAPLLRPVVERYGVLVRERYPHLVA